MYVDVTMATVGIDTAALSHATLEHIGPMNST